MRGHLPGYLLTSLFITIITRYVSIWYEWFIVNTISIASTNHIYIVLSAYYLP